MRSGNYPGEYSNNEYCEISITSADGVYASPTAFDTENGWDKLWVNGVAYSGSSFTYTIFVTETIVWSSDVSQSNLGWEICAAAASWYSSVTGDCTISDDCVRSGNYPGMYSNNEYCEITIRFVDGVYLLPTAFVTESSYDNLWVNDVAYSGMSFNETILVTDTIVWSSDYSQRDTGWEICPASKS